MKTLITYGSRYGSARQYAQRLAEWTGFSVMPYDEVKSLADCDRVIHFAALYAGGAMGLKRIASLLPEKAALLLVTVGLADPQDPENAANIRQSVRAQVPEQVFRRMRLEHLRGAIDYSRLSVKHRAMMALLCARAKRLPEASKNAETRALIATYGKRVSFVSETALRRLMDSL